MKKKMWTLRSGIEKLPWIVCALFLLSLSGCDNPGESLGIGRRPLISYMAPPVLSEDEKAQLFRWSLENKALFQKLQAHSNEQAAAIKTYNEKAIDINLKQNRLVNEDDKDAAAAAVRVQVRKAHYPLGHDIYKKVGEEKDGQ